MDVYICKCGCLFARPGGHVVGRIGTACCSLGFFCNDVGGGILGTFSVFAELVSAGWGLWADCFDELVMN